jgi:hypothetical protein
MNAIWRIKTILALAMLLSLNGCALPSLFNLDTHQINFKATTGDFRAERTMMAEALKYCDALDKRFIPVELTKSFLSNSYTLTFRCLDPDSPELQKQNQLDNTNKENKGSSDFLSSYQSNLSQS